MAENRQPEVITRKPYHALAGRVGDAQGYLTAIRLIQPRFTLDDYLNAFQFSDDAAALFRQAAGRISLR